jgi:hypothetical protein
MTGKELTMFPPRQVYRSPHYIPVVFDTGDLKQITLLHAFKAAFGKGHAKIEDLEPPRYRCLSLLPGGAREVQR